VALGETIAGRALIGHSYSAAFHQVEFRGMPLRSDTVEAASRTLLLLEELNRHRVTSIDRLHKATGLPKSTVVRLMKSLCAMGYAANDRRQGGYAVASRVKSLSNGFHGDPLVVEAARPWALAFTRQYHWPIAVAVLDRSSVVVRFSTIPDSPVSPFHATINMRLQLLSRALGRAYIAFCPPNERSLLLDMLSVSDDPEAQEAALTAMHDVLQVFEDDGNLTPLIHALSEGVDSTLVNDAKSLSAILIVATVGLPSV